MRVALVTGVAMLAATAEPLGAEELVVGFGSSAVWNSRADKERQMSFRVEPSIRLSDPGGDLGYQLSYRPVYEGFAQTSESNSLDHFLRASSRWRVSDATQLVLSGSVARLEDLSRRIEELEPDVEDPDLAADVELERQTSLRGTMGLSLSHRFAPRWSGAVRLGGSFFDYQSDDRTDNLSLTGGASLNHVLSARDTVGLGFGVSVQDFDAPSDQADRTNVFYNGFGFWQHRFSPTLSLSLQAGPAWVDPDDVGDISTTRDFVNSAGRPLAFREEGGEIRLINPITCPFDPERELYLLAGSCRTTSEPLVDPDVEPFELGEPAEGAPETGNGRFTFFAQTRLTKRWETLNASLGYTRSESTVSGQASTLLDSVTARLSWRASRVWTLSLVGSWNRRESATDQEFLLVTLDPVCADPGVDECTIDQVAGEARDLRLVEFDTDDAEIETSQLVVRVSRRIGRRTTLTGTATWLKQESKGEAVGSGRDFDGYRVFLGVNYAFDPIHF